MAAILLWLSVADTLARAETSISLLAPLLRYTALLVGMSAFRAELVSSLPVAVCQLPLQMLASPVPVDLLPSPLVLPLLESLVGSASLLEAVRVVAVETLQSRLDSAQRATAET